jgi:hypothetical protein
LAKRAISFLVVQEDEVGTGGGKRFGLMIDTARAKAVLMEKRGRAVVMVGYASLADFFAGYTWSHSAKKKGLHTWTMG